MAFKPGKSGNPNGRPKGRRNRATEEAKDWAERLLSDPRYERSLAKRLREGKAPHMETLLAQYRYGRPVQAIQHLGDEAAPLVFRLLSGTKPGLPSA